jgi:endonuclease YncB( thermonuclease family)
MKRYLTILVAVLLLTACSSGGLTAAQQTEAVNTAVAQMLNQAATDAALTAPTAEQPTSAPVEAATASSGQSNIPIPPEAACLPIGTDRVVGTVTDIWRSNEIGVEVNGEKLDVVYIGIDTTNIPIDANSQLVLGKNVLLIRDVTDVDQYGRLPRYVITEDGVFVNYQLVKQGVAFPSSIPPDTACDQAIAHANQ